jgi:hypothetical protein
VFARGTGFVGALAMSFVLALVGGVPLSESGGFGFGLSVGLAMGLVVSLVLGQVNKRKIWVGVTTLSATGIVVGILGGLRRGLDIGLAEVLAESIIYSIGFLGGLSLGFPITVFRLYYYLFHPLWLWPRIRKEAYRHHPVAWDDLCLLPFPGLDRLLVAYAEFEPEAGEREIDRLIDEYPSQRRAAQRARAALVAKRAAVAKAGSG